MFKVYESTLQTKFKPKERKFHVNSNSNKSRRFLRTAFSPSTYPEVYSRLLVDTLKKTGNQKMMHQIEKCYRLKKWVIVRKSLKAFKARLNDQMSHLELLLRFFTKFLYRFRIEFKTEESRTKNSSLEACYAN
jgi:hypothetical protein